MIGHDDCLVCGLLWSQYLKSSLDHLKLENKLNNTSRTRGSKAADTLILQLRLAETRKEQRWEAICRHDAEARAGAEARVGANAKAANR